ncbi:hypothetical protein [Maribacter sp.]|uniref:hypothetical protein n=1 Tax=Maribacter sp. TaxID=1897614 RepID=UPI00329A2C05
MKKIFSIVMITVMIYPSINKIGVLINFKINQNFIAKVLCINKEKPKSTCNGKCYLTKQLKKAEKQDQKQIPNSKKDRIEILYYYYKNTFNFLTYKYAYTPKINTIYNKKVYKSAYLSRVFRPPKFDFI